MEERLDRLTCKREGDLVGFLYNELNEVETRDFKQHLSECEACGQELASFRGIRAGVVAWRDESLGLSSLPIHQPASQPVRPSALAAIRKFFELSPLWLKGAVAFASVLVCVSAFLSISRLNQKPAEAVRSEKYSEAELKAKVEAEVQERLKELQATRRNDGQDVKEQTTPGGQKVRRQVSEAPVYSAKTKRAPLTKSEREQLAADLRLISAAEDPELNLLGEQINR